MITIDVSCIDEGTSEEVWTAIVYHDEDEVDEIYLPNNPRLRAAMVASLNAAFDGFEGDYDEACDRLDHLLGGYGPTEEDAGTE